VKNKIQWLDLAVLWVIIEHMGNVDSDPPTQKQLYAAPGGLVNDWLAQNGISRLYASPITGANVLIAAIERLRDAGLIANPPPDYTRWHYIPTQTGWEFFNLPGIGRDWRRWPVYIPINDDGLSVADAEYLPRI
jgi:hypothetical protein